MSIRSAIPQSILRGGVLGVGSTLGSLDASRAYLLLVTLGLVVLGIETRPTDITSQFQVQIRDNIYLPHEAH